MFDIVKDFPNKFMESEAIQVSTDCLRHNKVIINYPIKQITASPDGRLVRIEFSDTSFIAFNPEDMAIGKEFDVFAVTKFALGNIERRNIYLLALELQNNEIGLNS